MFLFDSGARVEELLNIKICDLSFKDNVYKVRIVHSKTKPRTIHLPICSKYISSYLKEFKYQPDEYLFPISYLTLRQMINRAGKNILNKNLTPHILRHSSATYYAHHLKHFQLCYRYGWTMSSNMPDRYLDREGMLEEETSSIIKTNDISHLDKENQVLNERFSSIVEENDSIRKELDLIKSQVSQLSNGKGLLELFALLQENYINNSGK